MPVAPGENEMTIIHFLDMCSQKRLDILLRETRYLLELINREETRLVGCLEVVKYFFQGQFRSRDVAKL